MGTPLRDRDDLPKDVARILAVRRHRGNPWTEHEALVVARFAGYTPTEPWPGTVGIAWRGKCHLGHPCGPTFSLVINGRRPCSQEGHPPEPSSPPRLRKRPSYQERREANKQDVLRIAAERGDEILAMETAEMNAGKIGRTRALHLTVRYACGHQSEHLAVKANSYKRPKKGGCGVCRPNRLIPGLNDLAVVRPDLIDELVDPTLGNQYTWASWQKVEWKCPEGHTWPAAIATRTILDSGCPECAHSRGYNTELPGTLYVVQGVSSMSREVLIKAGISNVPKRRLYSHQRQGLRGLLASLTWSDGEVAAAVEREWTLRIRKSLPDHLIPSQRDLTDGYREAAIDSDEAREALAQLLKFALAQSPETLVEEFIADNFTGRPTSDVTLLQPAPWAKPYRGRSRAKG